MLIENNAKISKSPPSLNAAVWVIGEMPVPELSAFNPTAVLTQNATSQVLLFVTAANWTAKPSNLSTVIAIQCHCYSLDCYPFFTATYVYNESLRST